jgi:hypothetical protein
MTGTSSRLNHFVFRTILYAQKRMMFTTGEAYAEIKPSTAKFPGTNTVKPPVPRMKMEPIKPYQLRYGCQGHFQGSTGRSKVRASASVRQARSESYSRSLLIPCFFMA